MTPQKQTLFLLRFIARSLTLMLLLLTIGCAAMRNRMAEVSARRIQSNCAPEQLKVSDTYNKPGNFTGTFWNVTCEDQVFECSGFPQLESSIKCTPVR